MMNLESARIYLYGNGNAGAISNPFNLKEADFSQLQLANLNRDHNQICRRTLEILVEVPSLLSDQTPLPPIMRDVGIFVGSAIRAGVGCREINSLPSFDLLTREATRQGRSPFHTVYEYAMLNSTEPRRSFTGTPQEEAFISATIQGITSMLDCASNLENIYTRGVDDPQSIDLATLATTSFRLSGHEIAKVMREVGGQFFADNLRPFFDPLNVGGRNYDAPGGSQMPMIYIDHLLFASDIDDNVFRTHTDRNMVYLPETLQKKIKQMEGRPSILTQIENCCVTCPCALPVSELMAAVYGFRVAHLKLAEKSFSYRETGAVGSGGADPTLLSKITEITCAQLQRAKGLISY